MRRFLAISFTTTALLAATGGVAWALYDRPAALGSAGGSAGCEATDHGTAADAAQAISGLTPGTRAALASATEAAGHAGLKLIVNSGYRSAAYQQRVFDCWVTQTGSTQAAREHALPPNESAHVGGYAIDVVPAAAASWLEESKGSYGLCRRYANEAWHFEYQASYKQSGCPALLSHP
ncbi:MAG: peptidase M15 [Catenulispora sp.]|nr:peptidase M15 [Catenulispora sp.]